MKRVLLLILVIGMTSVSCKKDEPADTPDPAPETDYMQLKIGNYWVYKFGMADTSKMASNSIAIDSIVITGDTIIGGNEYYTHLSVFQDHESYLRDSNGYLVDHLGKISFSDHDFTSILRMDSIGPGLAIAEYSMLEGDTMITNELGTFQAMTLRGTVIPSDTAYPHGIHYTYYFYADGYRMVKSSHYFFGAPHIRTEHNLIRFGNILEE